MQYRPTAERSLAIACRPSVCPLVRVSVSVPLVDCHHVPAFSWVLSLACGTGKSCLSVASRVSHVCLFVRLRYKEIDATAAENQRVAPHHFTIGQSNDVTTAWRGGMGRR